MSCSICSGSMTPCFTAQVLGKYTAQYEVCNSCGFLRVQEPHWLGEAYSKAIAAADTGLVMRNISLAARVAGVLYWTQGEHGRGRYLDAAGGYGMLTRLMRDFGFDFYWADKYCENLLAPGFDYRPELGACQAVTALEVLEHLTDPVAFVQETLAAAGARCLLFTTELYKGAPPPPDRWWYYTFATGQHIGFYQRKTLETLGERLGLRFSSAHGLHLLAEEKVNERWLALAAGSRTSRLGALWIRRRLGSKTIGDHQRLLQEGLAPGKADR